MKNGRCPSRARHAPATLRFRSVIVAALTTLAPAIARAGGGPENAILIIDPSSADSLNIGNYYKHARNIPDTNVLYLDPDAPDYPTFVESVLPGFLGHLNTAHIADHADIVVITPGNSHYIDAPWLVFDDCDVNRFAITTCFETAFMTGDILAANKSARIVNRYFSWTTEPAPFSSTTNYLYGKPSDDPAAKRYYLAAMLGYTGPLGNTTAEIRAMIDRSVAADGTFPQGTFYFMNNAADPPRNIRAVQYPELLSGIPALGGAATQLDGILPTGRQDCLGIMTGAAWPEIEDAAQNFKLAPGAFADHLTSWAARFDYNNQRKVSAWIRKGASGSAGTVEEPCSTWEKFPHARLHAFYYQGLSLGESYFRSAKFVPFQCLLYGDPLTRPFARPVKVEVAGLPKTAISGIVELTPSARASVPGPVPPIASFDVLIDGVLRASIDPGQKFRLNSASLNPGWHDLRILAHEATPVGAAGRLIQRFQVASPRSNRLVTPVQSGTVNTPFAFTVTGVGGTAREHRLLASGRVVAARPGDGSLVLTGHTLGVGSIELQLETEFTDGIVTRGPWMPVEIAPSTAPPMTLAPVAFGYTKTILRDSPCVVELPASLSADPAQCVFTVITPPVNATLEPGTKGFRVVKPANSPCGTDAFTFQVTTPHGTSPIVTVSLRYTTSTAPCAADINADGFVDAQDLDDFIRAFATGDSAADLNTDCFVDAADLDSFVRAFDRGC